MRRWGQDEKKENEERRGGRGGKGEYGGGKKIETREHKGREVGDS